MRFDPAYTESVVFLAIYQSSNQTYKMVGTAFFILDSIDVAGSRVPLVFLVTAKHILTELRTRFAVEQIFIRANIKNSKSAWIPTRIEDWYIREAENEDVAVLTFQYPEFLDHRILNSGLGLTLEIIEGQEISVGDEVFVLGLFAHHHGEDRNIPIARLGSIAAMPGEPVVTSKGQMEAFLVDVRSLGGLSGSPVFVNLGTRRVLNGSELVSSNPWGGSCLMGLVHGHFELTPPEGLHSQVEHRETREWLKQERVNVGIAIVVPWWTIRSVVDDLVTKFQGGEDIPVLWCALPSDRSEGEEDGNGAL